MSEKPLTRAQAFVLNWINEHGQYKNPNHPDGFRRLDVPPKARRYFGLRTLKVLIRAGYLSSRGQYVGHVDAEYRITESGKRALERQITNQAEIS